jgi:hypothetical protein
VRAEDIIQERYHLMTPPVGYEEQVRWTMVAMTVIDTIQTARQDREINPIFYGKMMGTGRAVLAGLIGYMLFDTVNYLVRNNPKLRQVFQESVLYTEVINVQANSQISTGEMRTRNTLIFFMRIPF